MRVLNGIVCVLLGLGSGYFMFIKAETDDDLIAGFMLLMMSAMFMCFMIMAEQMKEIEKLRRIISRVDTHPLSKN
jgi:hypothetical protein